MASTLLVPPASEPLSLAEMKAFLRVEHDDDDDLIAALAAAARMYVETATRRALITQTWRLTFDSWPADGIVRVVPAPLRDVVAARVYREDGSTTAIDPEAFVVNAADSTLAFVPWSLPMPGRAHAGIEIDIEAGYGGAADVPEPLRQAVRLLLTHWYENRGLGGEAGGNVPAGFASQLAHYRPVSL